MHVSSDFQWQPRVLTFDDWLVRCCCCKWKVPNWKSFKYWSIYKLQNVQRISAGGINENFLLSTTESRLALIIHILIVRSLFKYGFYDVEVKREFHQCHYWNSFVWCHSAAIMFHIISLAVFFSFFFKVFNIYFSIAFYFQSKVSQYGRNSNYFLVSVIRRANHWMLNFNNSKWSGKFVLDVVF